MFILVIYRDDREKTDFLLHLCSMSFMTEHEPSWWREAAFVGRATEAKKEEVRTELAASFHGKKPALISERDWELVRSKELEKKPQERAAIRIANEITNITRRGYGLEAFDIPEHNFLFLPEEVYRKEVISGGVSDEEFEVATSDTEHQRMYFREKTARLFPIHAAQTILHEIMHHKGVLSFEVPEEPVVQDETLKHAIPRREGLTAYSHSSTLATKEGEHEHFLGLDEAIVENYMIRHTPEILAQPEFAEERMWLMSPEAEKIKEEIAERERIPVSEIAWVTKDGKWQPYSYRPQREVLRYCVQEIAREFPENFQTPSEVLDRFEEGSLVSRRMLSLGRFVERTFGKGSFWLVGEMNDEKDEHEEDENMRASTILAKLHELREQML